MSAIKFSHIYIKMPDSVSSGIDKTADLLEVLIADSKDLSQAFIGYDTRIKSGGSYELPKGKVLILLLRSKGLMYDAGELWTTIRRHTPEKERYYKGLRGKTVDLDIIATEK